MQLKHIRNQTYKWIFIHLYYYKRYFEKNPLKNATYYMLSTYTFQ